MQEALRSPQLCNIYLLQDTCVLFPSIPDFSKTSYLISIFKSEDRADISNNRPIFNLSSIPKLFCVFKIDFGFGSN